MLPKAPISLPTQACSSLGQLPVTGDRTVLVVLEQKAGDYTLYPGIPTCVAHDLI